MTSTSERKRELKRAYRERPKPAGIFQVKNTVTGKVLLGSSLNLDGSLNRHRFMLVNGSHYNRALQQAWKDDRPGAFVFEILDVVDVKDEPGFNLKDELAALEQAWIEKIGPFGERTYNEGAEIRDV
ncbi:MAG: GIY-YIG nuclease family protein [Myxococcota bacterium]